MEKLEFELLRENDIELRVGQVSKQGDKQTLLLYKTSRTDANILDRTVGQFGWCKSYYELKGNIYCKVGIKAPNGEWVYKDDCGSESNVEKEKGEASDSFKRACAIGWGIGRELYTAPKIWVEKNDTFQSWEVKTIGYNENREINRLVIVDNKGKVVFDYYDKPIRTTATTTQEKKVDVVDKPKVETAKRVDTQESSNDKITDLSKSIIYRVFGQLSSDRQEKMMSFIKAQYKVEKIDDLNESQAQQLIAFFNSKKPQ